MSSNNYHNNWAIIYAAWKTKKDAFGSDEMVCPIALGDEPCDRLNKIPSLTLHHTVTFTTVVIINNLKSYITFAIDMNSYNVEMARI